MRQLPKSSKGDEDILTADLEFSLTVDGHIAGLTVDPRGRPLSIMIALIFFDRFLTLFIFT